MLLVGVIVVGILIYLVYTYTMGPGLDQNKCRSLVQSWCTSCKISNWMDGFGTIDDDTDLETCITTYFSTTTFTPTNADCNKTSGGSGGETKTFCEQFT